MDRKFLFTVVFMVLVGASGAAEDRVWGHPSRGLRLHVQIEGRTFAVGAPIVVSSLMQNVSDGPLTIWHSGIWLNHQFRVCNRDGSLAPLREFGEVRFRAFSPGGERRKNYSRVVQPGEVDRNDSALQDLSKLYNLTVPGLYFVQILYEEYQGGWEGQAWSNVVVIEVKEKAAQPGATDNPDDAQRLREDH